MIRTGQRLSEERMRRGLTVEEVSKAIKIRPSFITAIERGEYNKLPSSTYVQGFVRNYAEYLDLPKREILALFRREFDEDKEFKVLPEGFARTSDIPTRRIRIQQTVLIVLVILISLGGYIVFQYRYAIINPPLDIESPKGGMVSTSTIIVAGKTDPNATVSVNNDLVTLDAEGGFSKRLDIFPGKTTLTIRAANKFGKETVVKKTVELQ